MHALPCIACRFVKLPPWVKVMLTGRLHIRSEFGAWTPTLIEPSGDDNKKDMLELVRWQLGTKSYVANADIELATQLIWERSEVRCAWCAVRGAEQGARHNQANMCANRMSSYVVSASH